LIIDEIDYIFTRLGIVFFFVRLGGPADPTLPFFFMKATPAQDDASERQFDIANTLQRVLANPLEVVDFAAAEVAAHDSLPSSINLTMSRRRRNRQAYLTLSANVVTEQHIISCVGRLEGRNAQCLGDEISLKSCGYCLLRRLFAWLIFGTVSR
jgi:hypothetical protein